MMLISELTFASLCQTCQLTTPKKLVTAGRRAKNGKVPAPCKFTKLCPQGGS